MAAPLTMCIYTSSTAELPSHSTIYFDTGQPCRMAACRVAESLLPLAEHSLQGKFMPYIDLECAADCSQHHHIKE